MRSRLPAFPPASAPRHPTDECRAVAPAPRGTAVADTTVATASGVVPRRMRSADGATAAAAPDCGSAGRGALEPPDHVPRSACPPRRPGRSWKRGPRRHAYGRAGCAKEDAAPSDSGADASAIRPLLRPTATSGRPAVRRISGLAWSTWRPHAHASSGSPRSSRRGAGSWMHPTQRTEIIAAGGARGCESATCRNEARKAAELRINDVVEVSKRFARTNLWAGV